MAEFSMALSLRASQQTLAAKMRLRNQVNKVMIFVEVASALVMIQLGLITHALYCIFPFLFLAIAGVLRHGLILQESVDKSFVERIFLSIFSSEVSLLEKATTSAATRLPSLLARIACSFICYQLIAFGFCPVMDANYSCFSSNWKATTTVTVTMTMTRTAGEDGRPKLSIATGMSMPAETVSKPADWERWEGRKWIGWTYLKGERHWSRPEVAEIRAEGLSAAYWHFVRLAEELKGWTELTDQNAQDIFEKVCQPAPGQVADEFESEGFTLLVEEWVVDRTKLCGFNLIPAMFQPSCEDRKADSVQYQRCRQEKSEGGCNAAFMLCTTMIEGYFDANWFLLVFYFYLPHLAVCLLCTFWSRVACIYLWHVLCLCTIWSRHVLWLCTLSSRHVLWLCAMWSRHMVWFCTTLLNHLFWDVWIPLRFIIICCCGLESSTCDRLWKERRRRWKSWWQTWQKLRRQQVAEIERVAKKNAQAAQTAMAETNTEEETTMGTETGNRAAAEETDGTDTGEAGLSASDPTESMEERPEREEAAAMTAMCAKEELRKEIRIKSEELQAQLDQGGFDSLFRDRRSLELKVFFFGLDILLDLWCCLQYFLTENYGFAACQCTIVIISGNVQFFSVRGHDVPQALIKSWKVGLPTDTIFKLLVAEKAFEAPMSLCLQYFSAFHLTANLQAFVSLEISMAISIMGIGEGIYSSRLLAESAGQNEPLLELPAPPKFQKLATQVYQLAKLPPLPKLRPWPEVPALITDTGAPDAEVPHGNAEPLPPPPGLWVNQPANALPPPPGLSAPMQQPAPLPATTKGSPAMPPPGLPATGSPAMPPPGSSPVMPPLPATGSPAMPPPGLPASRPPATIGKQHGMFQRGPDRQALLPPIQLEGHRITETE